jgi:hypothetical protein
MTEVRSHHHLTFGYYPLWIERGGTMSKTVLIAAATSVLALAGVVGAGSAQPASPTPKLPRPADFVDRIDNKYFPLVPGTTFRYRGRQDGKHRVVTVFVTHRKKTIVGIHATVILDQVLVAGRPEEKTFDWYAQDKDGNVWYLGEDSSDFVNGKWVRSEGSWRTGVNGARPGIVMKAHPGVGAPYRQEYYKGHAEDMARVLSREERVSVPYGTFRHVLETSEWTPLERGVVEHKYYAAGIGNLSTVMVKGGSETEQLVSITK